MQIVVGQYWVVEAELANRRSDLPDLSLGVRASIAILRVKRMDRRLLNLKIVHGASLVDKACGTAIKELRSPRCSP